MLRIILRSAVLAALLSVAAPAPARAQHAALPLSSLRPPAPGPAAAAHVVPVLPDTSQPPPSDAWLLFSGAAAGGVGLLGGAVLGYTLETALACERGTDWCGLGGVLLGGLVGEVALLPLGVHLANRRQGSYGSGLLTSLGVVAAGLALASAVPERAAPLVYVIPAVQLVTALAVERGTARKRRRERLIAPAVPD